jgi:protein gp37
MCYIERTPPFRMEVPPRRFVTLCPRCAGHGIINASEAACPDCNQGELDPQAVGATTGVRLHPERLDQPLRWRRPRRIFVNSMSDLFHEEVPDEFVACIWAVMAASPQHTFQILTKRPARMRSLLSDATFGKMVVEAAATWPDAKCDLSSVRTLVESGQPLPNVWLGVSVESQKWADLRLPLLMRTPAAVRFASCEPLIGPVDIGLVVDTGGCTCGDPGYGHEPGCGLEPGPTWGWLDWAIVGGESGPSARRMDPAWAQDIVSQCRAVGVPCFYKQAGTVLAHEWGLRGAGTDLPEDPRQFPREFPEPKAVA